MTLPVHERDFTRTLLLALHEAQLIAAQGIGLRGDRARRSMYAERIRLRRKRHDAIIRASRKTEFKAGSEDDYHRSAVSIASRDAAREEPTNPVGTVSETRDHGGERSHVDAEDDAQGSAEQSGE